MSKKHLLLRDGLGIAANVKMKNVTHMTFPNGIPEFKESITLNQLTN